MKSMARLYIFLLGFFLLPNCGPSTNINQIFTDSADQERNDLILDIAREHYHLGEYSKALELLEGLNKKSPFDEEVAILMGFVYFASTGVDTFDMISNLGTSSASSSSGTETLSFLNVFNQFVSFSESDIEKIGDINKSNNSYFSGLPIFLPKTPGLFSDSTSPRYQVSSLYYLNSAMKVLCPFIGDSFFPGSTSEDYVDTGSQGGAGGRYNCAKTPDPLILETQIYFLYSLAHIIEASIFTNNGILYNPPTSSSLNLLADKTNLMRRGEALETTPDASKLSDYVSAIAELDTHINQIYNLSAGSLLSDTVVNLKVAILSMEKIPKMPTAFIGGLKEAIKALETGSKAIGTGDSGSGEQTGLVGALKKQMSGQVLTTVNSAVDTALQSGNIPADEKKELCDSLDTIFQGTGISNSQCS